jgi:hypothetical protein
VSARPSVPAPSAPVAAPSPAPGPGCGAVTWLRPGR